MQPREPRRKRERFVPEIGPAGSAHLTCLGRAKKHPPAIPAVKDSRSHPSTPHPYPAVGPQELEAEVEREGLRGSGRRPSGFPVRKLRHANLHGQFVSPIREKTTRRDPQIEHNVSS